MNQSSCVQSTAEEQFLLMLPHYQNNKLKTMTCGVGIQYNVKVLIIIMLINVKTVLQVIYVTWAGGICLICMHEPKDAQHLRASVNISGNS